MADQKRFERLGLEPGSVKQISNERPTDDEIAHSIAISLKRIADALTSGRGNAVWTRIDQP